MDIVLPIPKKHLIGHRGVAGLRPENTFCSFIHAAELGLDWIEFDVLLTKDDTWIVMHDQALDRTTTGHGLVMEYPLTALSDLEAGLWFRPPYPNEKIPSLFDTLQLAKKLNLFCNIELKNTERDPNKSASLISKFVQENANLIQNRILLSAFDLNCLILVRKHLPTVPIGYLIEQFAPDTIAIAQQYKFNSIHCNAEKMAPSDLVAATKAGIPVLLYTINDKSTANFWLNKGVLGIFTDRPDLLS